MAAAAGTAALPLASCASAGSGEVAIVGGGIAGLVALRTLTKAGISARLYEARRRIGGRVFTRTDFPIEGAWVEMGGQLVNSDHADMFALVKDFGLELIDRQALGGVDLSVRERQVVAEAALAAALGPIAAQIAEDSAGSTPTGRPSRPSSMRFRSPLISTATATGSAIRRRGGCSNSRSAPNSAPSPTRRARSS